MFTSTILFLNLLLLFVTGENVRDIARNGACDLNSVVRVGHVLRWRNPTNHTRHIRGEECHTKLNIFIPPEQSATYVFHIRGICQYRSSACPGRLGILNVKGGIKRRSLPSKMGNTDKLCTALCNGTQIKPTYVTSANLCRFVYDYVIHGVVNRYYTQDNKSHVELTVKHDFLQPICGSNCPKPPTYKSSFLWMPSSQNCTCPQLKIGKDILVIGFRSGTKFAIDTRSKMIDWDLSLVKNLRVFQQKVTTSRCSAT